MLPCHQHQVCTRQLLKCGSPGQIHHWLHQGQILLPSRWDRGQCPPPQFTLPAPPSFCRLALVERVHLDPGEPREGRPAPPQRERQQALQEKGGAACHSSTLVGMDLNWSVGKRPARIPKPDEMGGDDGLQGGEGEVDIVGAPVPPGDVEEGEDYQAGGHPCPPPILAGQAAWPQAD